MLYAKSASITLVLTWTLLSCSCCVRCQGNTSIGSDAGSSSSSSSSSDGNPVTGLLHSYDKKDEDRSSGKQGDKDDAKGGFPGGKPPVVSRCSAIPGCRVCPDGVCTACYYNYGGSRFQLKNGICRCPPGFGDISGLNLPSTPYMPAQVADTALHTAQNNTDDNSHNSTDKSFYDTDDTERNSVHFTSDNPSSAGFPNMPPWASACKACPSGSFSIGGDIGVAECQVCDQGFTSLPASADCTIRTDCSIGQQPNEQGTTCVPCRIGAYQDTASTGVCKPCPKNFTTVTTGSTSKDECIVPVCPAGQQLQTFNTGPNVGLVYWCANCTGMGFSKGGRVWQGADQPRCQPCVPPKVPTLDRTSCARNICPPPDAFKINCTAATAAARRCPGTAVNPRVVFLPNLCTASPHGAVLSWYKATACVDEVCAFNFNTPLVPPLADCPVTGIVDDTVPSDAYAAFITSFNGRTDCLCPVGQINCNFVTGVNTQTNFKPFTTATVGNSILITN